MQVTITQAAAADAGRLAALAALTFPLACPPQVSPQDVAAKIAQSLSQEAFERYLSSQQHCVLLASSGEIPGRDLGYTMLVRGEPEAAVARWVPGRPTAELSKCYTIPAVHGRGVARALMDETLQWADSWGLAGVWLGVNQLNARARRFYSSSGFTAVGTRQFQVGDVWCDDDVMWRASTQHL